jgi:hypothetical protein
VNVFCCVHITTNPIAHGKSSDKTVGVVIWWSMGYLKQLSNQNIKKHLLFGFFQQLARQWAIV